MDKTNIFIVNFNTTQLTNNAITSIRKFSDLRIILFDNSNIDYFKCENSLEHITIIDNTKQKIIDFDSEIKQLDEQFKIPEYIKKLHQRGNNFGSFKHTRTIQWAFDNLNCNNLILFDSDIIVKQDFSEIINSQYASIGQIENGNKHYKRIFPFIQYINLKLIRERGIKFFDPNRMQDISKFYEGYDTGGSFYEDLCLNDLPILEVQYNKYINHIGSGSWKNVNFKS